MTSSLGPGPHFLTQGRPQSLTLKPHSLSIVIRHTSWRDESPQGALVYITFPSLPNQTHIPKQQQKPSVVSQCLQDVQMP